MKTFFVIVVCVFVGVPSVIALASLLYTSFMLITGRMTKQQLAEIVAKNKAHANEQEKNKNKYFQYKKKSASYGLSDEPSCLDTAMGRGRGSSLYNPQITIKGTITFHSDRN